VHPVLLRLGPLEIPSYGALSATGMLLATWLSVRAGRRAGVPVPAMLDLMFWLLVAGLAGSWALHVALNAPALWRLCREAGDCLAAVDPRRAGFVWYGGALAAAAALWAFARRRRLNVWRLGDVLAPGAAIGQALGRLGCWAAGCCYGAPCAVPPGVRFPPGSLAWLEAVDAGRLAPGAPATVPLYPVQLWEAAGNAVLFGALLALRARKRFDGQVLCAYALGYAALRFGLELVRGDARGGVGPLSTSQLVAVAVAVAAAAAWWRRSRSPAAAAVPGPRPA
jgi:phosphatidylglycerol:prolipoprotein diacylglycerol transferase